MNRSLQSGVSLITGLLMGLSLSACASIGITISPPSAYVKFHAQMGTYVPPIAMPPTPDRVQVLIQDGSGNCVQTLALLSRLIDVIDHPDDLTNRDTWTKLRACSSEWVLPQPAAERIREYKIYGPQNGNYNAILIADDQSTTSSNALVDNLTIDAEFPVGAVGTPVQAHKADTILRDGNNTLLTTERGTFGHLSFTPTVLNLSATPPQGMGTFQFLAGNKADMTDRRVLIVLDGSFTIQPDRP